MAHPIRLSAPDTARIGEVIELKALIQHEMESGFRRGNRGQVLARNIITRFECSLDDKVFFSADFHPSMAANPLLTFHMRATKSGTLTFRWTDQNGASWQDTHRLTVI